MKKVLFTATVDSHIKQFHLPYLKYFKEHGYEVHVATNGRDEIPYCDVKHNISFERNPIKLNNIKAIKKLKKIIENEKYDIIHCHTPMGSVVTRLAAMKARKLYNAKVIYTAHGFHFFKGAPLLNWLVYYPVEKILANVTDCLITINEEDYMLAKKKFNVKDIELVNGVGVDINKFNRKISETEKEKLRKELGIKKDDFVIIYVAELSKRKNQGMLIKAISLFNSEDKYKNIKVILPGKDSMSGTYQEMAKKLNVDDKICFLGYRNDIDKLMKISDLAVSTSRQEGLPVNLIEAMMVGLPIIATNCRGNRDLINETIEIDDVEALKKQIIYYIDNRQLPEYKVDKFSLETIMKDMTIIYKKLLQKKTNS